MDLTKLEFIKLGNNAAIPPLDKYLTEGNQPVCDSQNSVAEFSFAGVQGTWCGWRGVKALSRELAAAHACHHPLPLSWDPSCLPVLVAGVCVEAGVGCGWRGV